MSEICYSYQTPWYRSLTNPRNSYKNFNKWFDHTFGRLRAFLIKLYYNFIPWRRFVCMLKISMWLKLAYYWNFQRALKALRRTPVCVEFVMRLWWVNSKWYCTLLKYSTSIDGRIGFEREFTFALNLSRDFMSKQQKIFNDWENYQKTYSKIMN
jgi:hypothetical protein